jgi:lipopolysaccharide transport system ATP-binding protein
MCDTVISVQGLSKAYRIGLREEIPDTLVGAATSWITAPWRNFQRLRSLNTFRQSIGDQVGPVDSRRVLPTRKTGPASASADIVWALRDVTIDVQEGDILGVIGRNGAGKSTLLKILSRITEPTQGKAIIRGRVSSLLEVGTGFHAELTGRENIYLNGTILGMKKREIDRKFDEIVEFSGVATYLDTPVKRYSSGMTVRLAFSVAAHLDPDILVVDEVLAVGDHEFQKKCLTKMGNAARDGRTVLFVSHNMMAVQNLCSRAVLLDQGRITVDGDVVSCLANYLSMRAGECDDTVWCRKDPPTTPLSIEAVTATLDGSQSKRLLRLRVHLASRASHKPAYLAFDIHNPYGTAIMQAIPTHEPFLRCTERNHDVDVSVELPPLVPSTYDVAVWVGSHNNSTLDRVVNCVRFEILEGPADGRTYPYAPEHHGYILPPADLRYLNSASFSSSTQPRESA